MGAYEQKLMEMARAEGERLLFLEFQQKIREMARRIYDLDNDTKTRYGVRFTSDNFWNGGISDSVELSLPDERGALDDKGARVVIEVFSRGERDIDTQITIIESSGAKKTRSVFFITPQRGIETYPVVEGKMGTVFAPARNEDLKRLQKSLDTLAYWLSDDKHGRTSEEDFKALRISVV